jgi:hypothetical protein
MTSGANQKAEAGPENKGAMTCGKQPCWYGTSITVRPPTLARERAFSGRSASGKTGIGTVRARRSSA